MTLPGADVVDVSVLVPAKDEAPNLPEFVERCGAGAGWCVAAVMGGDGNGAATNQESRVKSQEPEVAGKRWGRWLAIAAALLTVRPPAKT